jgi:AraC family transcriptional activator of pobA
MKKAAIIPLLKFEYGGLPVRIQTVQEFVLEEDDYKVMAHSHDFYEMIWIIKGHGLLQADLKQYEIGDQQLFCIKPGQVHQLRTTVDTEGFILSFSSDFLNAAEQELDYSCPTNLILLVTWCQVISIRHEMATELGEIIGKMISEIDNAYSFRSQLLSRYFKILLIHLSRQFEECLQLVKLTREMELVKGFMDIVERRFKEMKQVAEYASLLQVTPNYLNCTVKKNTGYSAGHHIRQRVVLEAKRMATYSDEKMKTIAYNLGFSDSAHFSKFFKAASGMVYSDFKKQGLSYVVLPEQILIA